MLVSNATLRTDFNHFLRPEIEAMGIRPYDYYRYDVWDTRQTLGLVENEMHLREDGDFNATRLNSESVFSSFPRILVTNGIVTIVKIVTAVAICLNCS